MSDGWPEGSTDEEDATDDEPTTRRTPVVVVVEPETPGNVGTIARAMRLGSTISTVDPAEWPRTASVRVAATPARTCCRTPRR
jgi:SpoU rRNA Methylase family.